MELSPQIEALLFFRGEPVKRKELAKLLGAKEGAVEEGIAALKGSLMKRGLALIEKDDELMLATAPEQSELIEHIRKEELSRDLGRAGAETLAIVLYRGASTRADIDYIRGVNSTFILRNLLVRGLVERVPNPVDQRSFVYKPTIELLSHLGVRSIDELPDYGTVQKELQLFTETIAAEEAADELEHGDEH